MSSLIVFSGVDTHGTGSIYLATDSKISFDLKGQIQWSYGRKTFAPKSDGVFFGYCGTVVFPALCLSQINDLINLGAFFSEGMTSLQKYEKFCRHVTESFNNCEAKAGFNIVFGARDGVGKKCKFFVWEFSWSPGKNFTTKSLELPATSDTIVVLGSGENSVNDMVLNWSKSSSGGTSRAIFSAFCDSISSGVDKFSGGAPQIVSLFREGGSNSYGFIQGEDLFSFGMRVEESDALESLRWTNNLFEVCDWKTKKRKPDAQPQPRPNDV